MQLLEALAQALITPYAIHSHARRRARQTRVEIPVRGPEPITLLRTDRVRHIR